MQNRVSFVFTEEAVTAFTTAVEALKTAIMSFLITLTKEERKSIAKMEEGSELYVGKALSLIETNSDFKPASVNAAEFRKDFDAYKVLSKLEDLLTPVMTAIVDTKMQCGAEAYSAFRAIYKTVKQAAGEGVTGAKDAFDSLSGRFEGQGNFNKGSIPDNPPAA